MYLQGKQELYLHCFVMEKKSAFFGFVKLSCLTLLPFLRKILVQKGFIIAKISPNFSCFGKLWARESRRL